MMQMYIYNTWYNFLKKLTSRRELRTKSSLDVNNATAAIGTIGFNHFKIICSFGIIQFTITLFDKRAMR